MKLLFVLFCVLLAASQEGKFEVLASPTRRIATTTAQSSTAYNVQWHFRVPSVVEKHVVKMCPACEGLKLQIPAKESLLEVREETGVVILDGAPIVQSGNGGDAQCMQCFLRLMTGRTN